MKSIFLLFLLLVSGTSFGQCITSTELAGLFSKDMEGTDDFMEARGLKVYGISDRIGIITWRNKVSGDLIHVNRDDTGKVGYVVYELNTSDQCFERIREGIKSSGFAKDYERMFTNNGHQINCYYSNATLGITICKGYQSGGAPIREFWMRKKPGYLVELARARAKARK